MGTHRQALAAPRLITLRIPRRPRWAAVLGLACALLLGVFLLLRPAPDKAPGMTELPGLLLGEQAPAFTLDDATGRLVRLAQFRGHRALLNFWSTTCVPCTGEMPLLQRALDGLTREARARHAAPPVILGIDATTESAAMIRQFGRQHGVHYTLLLDPRMEVTLLRYHVADIPTSVVLDAAGRIRFVHVGALTEQDVIRALTTAG